MATAPVKGALDRSFDKVYPAFFETQPYSSLMPKRDREEELDLSDLLCPLPVLKARKRLAAMTTGDVLKIIATDPLAATDMAHFCVEQGHILLEQSAAGGKLVFRIRRK
jgi:tRNA 2-thiouridine synthesizing protein A